MNNLKSALIGNAIFSGFSGSVMTIFAQDIAKLFGLENGVAFRGIGIALLFFALTVWYESRRLRPAFVYWIIIQDALWVLGSLILLIFKPFGISDSGNFLIAAVALIVVFFGWRQWVGIRRV
jgi:hypothetical protein